MNNKYIYMVIDVKYDRMGDGLGGKPVRQYFILNFGKFINSLF